MVKVLIVHDRPAVLAEIRAIVEALGIPSHMVFEAEDGATTRSLLGQTLFDVAVMDLTIPAVKGMSEPGYSTAEDIFVELFKADTYNIPGDIIGITKEASALARLNSSIGPHLMAVIEEDEADAWKGMLTDRLSYVFRSAHARLLSISQRFDYDVAIITALDKEMEPFSTIFDFAEVPHYRGANEFIFRDKLGEIRRGVAYSVGGAGQAGCASATQAMIARFRPRAFFLSGFCGGYQKQTSPGEVLLFRTVYDWDSGKWTGEDKSQDASALNSESSNVAVKPEFLPRADPVTNGDGEAYRIMRELEANGIDEHASVEKEARRLSSSEIQELKISMSLTASGSAVVANSTILGQIRKQHDKIVGVDMEAYGFYQACAKTPCVKPEMLCVKAVADFCDGEKHDRLHKACCYLSAKTVEDIILNRWAFVP